MVCATFARQLALTLKGWTRQTRGLEERAKQLHQRLHTTPSSHLARDTSALAWTAGQRRGHPDRSVTADAAAGFCLTGKLPATSVFEPWTAANAVAG